jgi:hypothetical protein
MAILRVRERLTRGDLRAVCSTTARPAIERSDSEMALRHVIQRRRIAARQRECVETLAHKGLDTH